MCPRENGVNINGFFPIFVAALVVLGAKLIEGFEETERHPNDGWFNNLNRPDWGAIDTNLLRMSKAAYADGSYEPSGTSRPNPLDISNMAFKGPDGLSSARNRNALLVYFGQQLVEEIVDAQRPGCPREYFNIPVPKDHHYNPDGKDDLEMPFLRSRYDQRTGHSPNSPRQQLNEITPYIDGNLFYGAGKAWEDSLRSFKDGLLLANSPDVKDAFPVPNDIRLPFANPPIPRDHILCPVKRFRHDDEDGDENDNNGITLYPSRSVVASSMSNMAVLNTELENFGSGYGNPRTHENPFLNALGVVWFRYHNHIATVIKERQPTWTDEQIFNAARKRVIAQYQKIVMYEWLPAWLRVSPTGVIYDMKREYPYQGGGRNNKYANYDQTLHPGITVEFQAAAMRYGHTLVPSHVVTQTVQLNTCNLTRSDVPTKHTNTNSSATNDTIVKVGGIRLCNSFWVPEETLEGQPGVSSVIMGMIYTRSAKEDHIIVSDIRENTFGPLEWSRRDLGALNIQRGRDHGLPGYNDVREAYGLKRKGRWEDISNLKQVKPILKNLSALYESPIPDDLDLFPGGLLETTPNGPGPLFFHIILDQFLRIRHADRFWYENMDNKLFSDKEIKEIESTNFYDVLQSVMDIPLGGKREKNVFICSSSTTVHNCHCHDPVVQGNDIVEKCTPLLRYDYFTNSDFPYILVIILLFMSIVVTCGIMYVMANHRQQNMVKAVARARQTIKPPGPNQVYATEWVGRTSQGHTNTRDVFVELNIQRRKVFVSNFKGHVIRMIDMRRRLTWEEGQCKVSMRSSCDKGYRLLIVAFLGEIDLVLFFPTQHEREGAITKFEQFFNNCEWEVEQGHPMDEQDMWRDAKTVDQRKKVLAKFFREILKELSKDGSSDQTDCNNCVDQVEEEVLTTKLTRTEFADALGLQPHSLFVRNMFLLADTDGEGFISFDEFKSYFGILCKGTQTEKAEMFFKMFDTSRAGKMTKQNYKNMIKSFSDMTDTDASPSTQDLNDMVDTVFSNSGLEQQGYMTLDDFRTVFFSGASDAWRKAILNLELNGQSMSPLNLPGRKSTRQPIMQRTVSFFAEYRKTVATPLSSMSHISTGVRLPSQHRSSAKGMFQSKYFAWSRYTSNHWRQIFWLSLYVMVTLGIFVERFYHFFREREHAGLRRIAGMGVSVTRGAASAQMFTFSSLPVTMSRNTLTYFRATFLHSFIPFDNAHDMHICIAWMAVFFTVVHVIGHMFNFYQISTQPSTDLNCYFREFFRSSDSLASFQYWFFTTVTGVTGFVLTILLMIMVMFAIPYARRHLFHSFAITHNLAYLVYFIMFLHGAGRLVQEPFWAYFFLGPMVLFLIDKMVSVCRHKLEIPVLTATLLPSEVINLVFKRPLGFNYKSGQWVRIACPDLGSSQYHPFTLTSAPHEENLSLHIRAVGPWTNNLRALFKDKNSTNTKLYLDGPFGESHQDWFRFPVSVLIGGGIGITPFASILKEIAENVQHNTPGKILCTKLYFLWVTRTQRSFEWMTDIIQQVEKADTSDFVGINICITQMKDKFDLRTVMLYVCERHFQKIAGVSMFTGLRARTHFGRPKFPQFFEALKNEHQNVCQIGVFSCGPPALIRSVKGACAESNRTEGPALIHHYENI